MDLNALVDRYREAIRSRDPQAVAMIVRITGRDAEGNSFDMANALHFYHDAQGFIARMINWYGMAA